MEFHVGCKSDAAKPNVDVSVVAIGGCFPVLDLGRSARPSLLARVS
jgi:hypothetical protein